MDRPYQYLEVRREGEIFCVRLRCHQFSEEELQGLFGELQQLLQADGCRKLLLSLGPPDPQCLYSVFLARLVSLQRRLQALGGGLKLCGVSPFIYNVFAACRLDCVFDFVPDEAAGIRQWSSTAHP